MKFRYSRSGETIAALFLFAAAALLMCGVVAFGAEGYAAIRAREQNDAETAVQYIATKVRAADVEGGIVVESDRICLHEFYGEDNEYDYVTELYIYDGSLCELYHDVTVELDDSDGLPVLPADRLSVSTRASTEDAAADDFTITVTSGDESRTMSFSPRSGYEGGAR